MRKRILSVLLSVWILVCLAPVVQISAETYVLDKSYWRKHCIELCGEITAIKTSLSVPEGTRTFDLNKSGTVVGCVREEENEGKTCKVCYIAPAEQGNSVELPEDSSNLFAGCCSLKEIDLRLVYTGKVTSMKGMFVCCLNLTSLLLSDKFNTNNVTDMSDMFNCCHNLKSLDVSCFDTSNVTNMSGMFNECSGLTSLDVSHFDVRKVGNIKDMFWGCSNLRSLYIFCADIGDIKKIRGDLPGARVFCEVCVIDKDFWREKWKTIEHEVNAIRIATSVPEEAETFNLNKSGTALGYVQKEESEGKVQKVCYIAPVKFEDTIALPEDSSCLFKHEFSDHESTIKEIDLRGIDTSGVKNMNEMFEGLMALRELCVTDFDTSNVTYMRSMFAGCKCLENLDLTQFDTRSVTDMRSMFKGSGFINLDLSNFDTCKVTDMSQMFSECRTLANLDITRHFNTSNVESMFEMFKECRKLTSLDVSGFNTSKVTNMKNMFRWCESLKSLDVTHFDTKSATNMCGMFSGCKSLTSLDVTNFDTSNVTDMEYMFSGCENLVSLDVSNFDTGSLPCMSELCILTRSLSLVDNFMEHEVEGITYMFLNCKKLKSLHVFRTADAIIIKGIKVSLDPKVTSETEIIVAE